MLLPPAWSATWLAAPSGPLPPTKPVCSPRPPPQQSGLHPTSGSGSGARTGSTSNGLHKGDLDLDLASVPCDWKLSPDELEFLNRPDGSPWQLGSGGFGVVMKARCNGAQPVAVKVLRPTTDVTGRLSDADFAREISILRACRDANILQFVVRGQGVCVCVA